MLVDTKLVDLLEAKDVEISIDRTGKLWVNVDSVCLLRVGHVYKFTYTNPSGVSTQIATLQQ